MELYRSSYALDEDVCREISPFFWPRSRIWLNGAAAAVMGVIALMAMARREYVGAVLFLTIAVCFAPTPGTRRTFCWRVTHTRLYESSPGGHITSFCTEEGISVQNLTTAGQSMIRYGSIRRAAETEHYFLLCIKTGYWYTLVSKDCLTLEEQTAFLPFLREKCPKLKVIQQK